MTINVNNKQQNIKELASLRDVINAMNISMNGIAIAINNVVVVKQEWDTTLIKDNDDITIIQATQGG